MATGKHCPTIGTAFGDVEFFSWFEEIQDREVVDYASASIRKSESGAFCSQVPPLDSNQLTIDVVIRYLEPVLPAGEPAPTDNTRVDVTFLEEKFSSSLIDERPVEVLGVLLGGEG